MRVIQTRRGERETRSETAVRRRAERSGFMDCWMNGLMVSDSLHPIIQQPSNPFIP